MTDLDRDHVYAADRRPPPRRRGPFTWIVVLAVVALLAVGAFFLFGGDVDVDSRGGDIDLPQTDVDVDAPDVDVESPDVSVDPGSIDVDDADADAGN